MHATHATLDCWCAPVAGSPRLLMSSAPPPPSLTSEQQQLYRSIEERMRADGTREDLKNYLRETLLEGQWKRDLTAHAQGIIYEKGLAGVTVDGLVESTHAKAVETISPATKQQMMEHIKQTLIQQAEDTLAAASNAQPAGS